jgi:hypothetical protein
MPAPACCRRSAAPHDGTASTTPRATARRWRARCRGSWAARPGIVVGCSCGGGYPNRAHRRGGAGRGRLPDLRRYLSLRPNRRTGFTPPVHPNIGLRRWSSRWRRSSRRRWSCCRWRRWRRISSWRRCSRRRRRRRTALLAWPLVRLWRRSVLGSVARWLRLDLRLKPFSTAGHPTGPPSVIALQGNGAAVLQREVRQRAHLPLMCPKRCWAGRLTLISQTPSVCGAV